jgi:proteasome assembly chaperone (PAC2) family protein
MTNPLKHNRQIHFDYSSVIIGWGGDAGKVGEGVTDYIIKKLNGHLIYEIDPEDYFQLGAVTIEDDLVQYPESKFYACPPHNLLIFKSTPPVFETYKFLEHILDFAEEQYKVKHLYAIRQHVIL